MFPTAFHINAVPVTWRGLIMALAVATALAVAVRDERWMGFSAGTALRFAVVALPVCYVGARLFFLAFTWERFAAQSLFAFDVWGGGFALYGAIIAGGLAAIVFAHIKGIPIPRFLELWAAPLMLAIAVGRMGDLANLECYGPTLTDAVWQRFPFGVYVARLDEWHLALFFFESIGSLLIFAYLLFRRAEFQRRGDAMAMAMLLYGGLRCWIESFREDSLYLGFVRVSQLCAILSVLAVTAWFWYRAWQVRRRPFEMLAWLGLDAVFLTTAFLCEFYMSQENWARNHVVLAEMVVGMLGIALIGYGISSGVFRRPVAALEPAERERAF